ncbi:MAG: TraR/DksA family transcriptional regulator [Pseudomonadota bacterium]
MVDTEQARQKLLALRDGYTRRIAALDGDLHHREQAVEKDFAEQATQRENDSVLAALDDEARVQVGLIDAALARIEGGSYGSCVRCGEEIAAGRLEAVPYSTLCIACAEQ